MIRSRVSSRVKRLRAEWVVIKVMKYIIRHIFAFVKWLQCSWPQECLLSLIRS
jgi:hypothetical protein